MSLTTQQPDQRDRLQTLRQRVRRLEGGRLSSGRYAVYSSGLKELDEVLPGGGLPFAGLQDIHPARPGWDDAVVAAFALCLLAPLLERAEGQVLWCSQQDDLYAPALTAAGFDNHRLLRVSAAQQKDLLWALEEGLRCPDIRAVVGEVTSLDSTAGRRLQLAAETAGRPCLLLHRPYRAGGAGRAGPARLTWQVAARGSSVDALAHSLPGQGRDLLGAAGWQVDLLRCRQGQPARLYLEWDHETSTFALAAGLRDRPAVSQGT